MINKKIASEVAVGTVLILAVAIGGIFWMEKEKIASQKDQVPLIINNEKVEKVESDLETENRIEKIINLTSTFPVVSEDERREWKTYENKKYGYRLNYPSENINCIEDDFDPEDELSCSYIKNDGRLYVSVKPLKISKNKKQIIFNPVIGIGSVEMSADIENGDIINAIEGKLKDSKKYKDEHPYLSNYKQMYLDNFNPFMGVSELIGFSDLDVSTSGIMIGRPRGSANRSYERVWFFEVNNTLFQLYSHYDDLISSDKSEKSFISSIEKMPDIEKIFSTLEFK